MVLGDLDSYMTKNQTQPPTYTVHKNKLKVDKILVYKSRQHKSLTGEHKQGNFRIPLFLIILFLLG